MKDTKKLRMALREYESDRRIEIVEDPNIVVKVTFSGDAFEFYINNPALKQRIIDEYNAETTLHNKKLEEAITTACKEYLDKEKPPTPCDTGG